MAYAIITLKNNNTGFLRKAPIGFSWTTLFFGFFPALFRSDWKWSLIIFLIALITVGISNIIFAFIYNNLYTTDLINNGFAIHYISDEDLKKLKKRNPELGLSLGVLKKHLG